MKTLTEMFGEPISTYSDNDAGEDGTLVAINAKDRVTRPVWDWLESTVDMKNPKPPSCWPVDLFGFFGAKKPADRALAMCRGIIENNRREAMRVYEQNIGGGIFTLWVLTHKGKGSKPLGISATQQPGEPMRLWFVPNGAGLTMMFPEDY
jgi:hypothetical protein